MIYTIAAHPTKYKGALFRSRLEATWAAFFDLCGAEWQYEPIDLRGWTPDFQVQYSGRLDVYAEVKPGRDEEEIQAGHAQHRGQERRPPFEAGGHDGDAADVHHHQIRQLQMAVAQSAADGGDGHREHRGGHLPSRCTARGHVSSGGYRKVKAGARPGSG